LFFLKSANCSIHIFQKTKNKERKKKMSEKLFMQTQQHSLLTPQTNKTRLLFHLFDTEQQHTNINKKTKKKIHSTNKQKREKKKTTKQGLTTLRC